MEVVCELMHELPEPCNYCDPCIKYGCEHVNRQTAKEREKIVRCKDCEHFENNEASGLHYCWLFDTDTRVNPDGFCAWGEMVE